MTITNLAPSLEFQAIDQNGVPLANGQVWTYQAGTLTPQATYTDATGAYLNPNPVVLDAAGRASIWLDATLVYKFVVQDVNSVTQYTQDNVSGVQQGALTASTIGTYAPALDGTGATGVWNIDISGTANAANSLNTTGLAVNVAASSPPTVGQTLVATSTTTATWQTVGAGGGGNGVVSINSIAGNVYLLAGANVSITSNVVTGNITISSTGGGGGGGGSGWDYVSSPTAITTNVGCSVSHGLAGIPTLYDVVLKCVTTQGGYAVGDEISAVSAELLGGDGGGNGVGCTPSAVWVSPTQIGWNMIYPAQATLNYLILQDFRQ